MRPLLLTIVAAAVIQVGSPTSDGPDPSTSIAFRDSDILVSIAAPARFDLRHVDRTRFRVVLVNQTMQPRRIWREWCSWGYFCLTFDVKKADGTWSTLRKKPRGWGKNYPDHWELAPQESWVIDVGLGEQWEGVDGLPTEGPITMRARYSIGEDPAQKEHKVWTGTAVTPWRVYQLDK